MSNTYLNLDTIPKDRAISADNQKSLVLPSERLLIIDAIFFFFRLSAHMR